MFVELVFGISVQFLSLVCQVKNGIFYCLFPKARLQEHSHRDYNNCRGSPILSFIILVKLKVEMLLSLRLKPRLLWTFRTRCAFFISLFIPTRQLESVSSSTRRSLTMMPPGKDAAEASYIPGALTEERQYLLQTASSLQVHPQELSGGQWNSSRRLWVGAGSRHTSSPHCGILFCRCYAKKGKAWENVERMHKCLEAASLDVWRETLGKRWKRLLFSS